MKKSISSCFKLWMASWFFLALHFNAISQEQLILLSDEEFSEDNLGGSENITGYLQASKSTFLKASAFNFGQSRFRVRGYDSKEGLVLMNGFSMNKIYDGRPQWSNWGGLNDVLRNQTFTYGLKASEFGVGRVLGTTNFDTRALHYKRQNLLSIASANTSYRTRVMASHFSGVQKNDWAYVISISRRFSNESVIQGSGYEAISGFVSLGKKIKNHELNFASIVAFNQRGKNGPITNEVFQLKGANYNSYWGYQNGQKRNSRIKEVFEPLFLCNHDWKISETASLHSGISYQLGTLRASRLGYHKVANPDPTYYKKLPSFYLSNQEYPDYQNAYLTLQNFKTNGQIDWRDLYTVNSLANEAKYYLLADATAENTIQVQSRYKRQLSNSIALNLAMNYKHTINENYAELLDLLGGKEFSDIDFFAEAFQNQNNLEAPNRKVSMGDKFQYHYQITAKEISFFVKLRKKLKRIEFDLSVQHSQHKYHRNGFFRNGKYPFSSSGKDQEKRFLNTSVKANFLYKHSGKHLFSFDVGRLSFAPFVKSLYTNPRESYRSPKNLKSEIQIAGDFSYLYRGQKNQFNFRAYHTYFTNAAENYFSFSQGLEGDKADFIAISVSGIDKIHRGLELSINQQISPAMKVYFVGALGQYFYANNPELFVESDTFLGENSDFGTIYLKNYKIAGSPQQAFSVGFEYQAPSYWWLGVNWNYVAERFVQISPLLRAENFYLDADGVPFIDIGTQQPVTEKQVSEILTQEKLQNVALVNLVGGKSIKIHQGYLGFFLSINNVFGAQYRTGGFEQSRKANYQELAGDRNLTNPLFSNKYWYSQGTSYFLNINYRF